VDEKWTLNFPYQYISYLKGSLTCHKILRHGADGFTSPPKEVVLRIVIALKIPSLSAGFEPANLGSNGKHDNNYTTENDPSSCNYSIFHFHFSLPRRNILFSTQKSDPRGPVLQATSYKQSVLQWNASLPHVHELRGTLAFTSITRG
jgi:hypothetical protein